MITRQQRFPNIAGVKPMPLIFLFSFVAGIHLILSYNGIKPFLLHDRIMIFVVLFLFLELLLSMCDFSDFTLSVSFTFLIVNFSCSCLSFICLS